MVIEATVDALSMLVDPSRLLWLLLGILMGITVGVIPGLSGVVGMAMLLPFVYGMDPVSGLGLLIGVAAVTHTSDTFTAVLVGVPGTAGAQATIMDGHPLAQRGQAGYALGAAFVSSMIGGVIGAIVLYAVLPAGRTVALALGSPELFMVAMLGLSMVALLSLESPQRGLLAAALGLMLGTVGGAPAAAEYRYTLDFLYLYDGIPLVAVALGLFGLPEVIDLLFSGRSIASSGRLTKGQLAGVRDAVRNWSLILRMAPCGAVLAAIPGIGASVIDWLAYGLTARTVRHRTNFGRGDIRGVIAPESANNAKESGTLVPTLLFGVPGSGTSAVLLGGMVLLGIEPGPDMVTTKLPITLSIIWTLVLANVIGAGLCMAFVRPIARLSIVPAASLVPFLIVVMTFAVFQSSERWGDIISFAAIGAVGWLMKHQSWPRPPLLIGFVLAAPVERYLSISVSRYGAEWLGRPGVLAMMLILVGLIVLTVWRQLRSRSRSEGDAVMSDRGQG